MDKYCLHMKNNYSTKIDKKTDIKLFYYSLAGFAVFTILMNYIVS